MKVAATYYSCPPERIRNRMGEDPYPWCDRLPCHGHRATRDMILTAKVIAWSDGLEWDDPGLSQRAYLAKAREVLAQLGYVTGRPR